MKKVLLPILILGALGLSRTRVQPELFRPFQIKEHNINNIQMLVSNFGKFGQTEGTDAGMWWPKNSGQNYIFGAGPWFGTIDSVTGDTLVSVGYNPNDAHSEFVPGLYGMSFADPQAVLFISPENFGEIDYSIYPMAPRETKSHQDSWCAFNDGDINFHHPGDTRPIGVEIYQTVYAWNLSATLDIIFVKYELKNVSGQRLTDVHFAITTDNDIGNEAGANANDRVAGVLKRSYIIGADTFDVDNLAYQWQDEMEPNWGDEFPGTIGFDYLQSPWDIKVNEDKDNDTILDQYEMDSSHYVNSLPSAKWDVDADGTPDWRDPSEIPQLGMTALKRVTIDIDPQRDAERYLTIAGYDYKTGIYSPYDTVPSEKGDQRFSQCSGPFEMEPDETATILVGIMCARWKGLYATPDSALAKVDDMAQYIYDMNWLLPGPPPPPTLTCVPGDKKITLIWDNRPEKTPDPYYKIVHFADTLSQVYDPYYLEYDFEGYRVWKSLTGKPGSWQLLASFDKYNDITFEDTLQPEPIRLKATNTGIVHSYTDTDVRNGFNYYYAVTAFDYNYVKEEPDTFRALYFESGHVPVPASPRREPADYKPGSCSLKMVSGNPRLLANLEANITYPLNMTSDSLFAQFAPIVRDSATGFPVYSVALLNQKNDTLHRYKIAIPLDTFGYSLYHEFPQVNGLSVKPKIIKTKVKGAVAIFDTIIKQPGSTYPDTLLSATSSAALRAINWAYRGNDFEVRWIKAHNSDSVNSVIVIDMHTGDTIPYKPYGENLATDSLADGWCFRPTPTNPTSTDTLVYGSPGVATRTLYICGGKIEIARGWLNTEPRPSANDVWIIKASPRYHPAPVKARIAIIPIPSQLLTDTPVALNVKVVPNPYIMGNEWQQSSMIRRLRFINLPSRCTIRIFNLNGELVKTIFHKETIPSQDGKTVLGNAGGDAWWDLLSENNQLVASGVYIFHVRADVGEQVGKFVIIR